QELLLHAGAVDADGALGSHDRAELPALQVAWLARHARAADRAALVRRRPVLHLPAAAVLPDDPARLRRGGQDRWRELDPRPLGDPGPALPAGDHDRGDLLVPLPLERLHRAADLPEHAREVHDLARPALLPDLAD